MRLGRSPWFALAIALLSLLGLLGLVLAGGPGGGRDAGWLVEVDMAVDTASQAQLFAGTAAGYEEASSARFALAGDGTRQRHRVRIPAPTEPVRVRLDPGTAPGRVKLHAISVIAPDAARQRHAGDALAVRLHPLHDVQVATAPHAPADGAVALLATGIDPHVEVALDPVPAVDAGSWLQILAAAVLTALLLAASLRCWCAWRGALPGLARRHLRLLAVLALPAALGVLWLLDVGCATATCSTRAWRHGPALFLAACSLAVVGAAILQGRHRSGAPRGGLFLSLLVGQVALVLYVYLRSLLHAVLPQLPLTRLELLAVVAIALAALALPRWRAPGQGWRMHASIPAWWMVQLACLAAACLVVADRELPRLVMLSSDPDTHAFFARQVERMGAIYRDQGDWGSEGLGYPAGTAALVFAWSRYAWLDVSNMLAALPLLQAFIAALALGELVAMRTRRLGVRSCVLLVALAVTAAAFLFPLYQRFSHMEGVGRQLSIGCVALMFALLARAPAPGARVGVALLLTANLFVLATLNPVNVVMPCLLVAAFTVATFLRERRVPWWLLAAPLACPLLLLVDPYYAQLLTGGLPPTRLAMDAGLLVMSPAEIASAWWAALRDHAPDFVRQQFLLLPEHAFPAFLLLAGGFGTALLVASPAMRVRRGTWVGAAVLCALVIAASALMQAVSTDSRLYLLAYYFQFSLAQYRALLVTLFAAALVLVACRRRIGAARIALVAVLCTLLAGAAMRAVQPMVFTPRHDYCGAFGCARDSDVAVVHELEAMVRDGRIARDAQDRLPRVLVPNQQARSGPEAWVFPTGGSRLLAVADALPVAFYYYQGDPDFTTRNYMDHVCTRLDREWLLGERIHYVFLPADRDGVCLASMESLPATDDVVLREGDSMLIRLRAPTKR